MRTLSRAWQILLKGIPEVQASNRPIAAAEMVLVRLAYAADLPTPDEALRALKDGAPLPAGGPRSRAVRPSGAPASSGNMALADLAAPAAAASRSRPQPEPTMRLRRFEDVVAMAGEKREIVLKARPGARCASRPLRGRPHRIQPRRGRQPHHRQRSLARAPEWTGQRWMVALSSEAGAPTLHEQAEAAERERKEGAANHPLVQAVLAKFPGAQIVNVIERVGKDRRGCAPDAEIPARPIDGL